MKEFKLLRRIPVLLLLMILFVSICTPQIQAASNKFNAKTAKKNINAKYYKLPDGILAICKNKNNYAVTLEGKVTFLDAEKHKIAVSEDVNYCLGANQTCALFYKAPLDANSNYIVYASSKKSLKVSKCAFTSYSKKIQAATNMLPSIFNLSVMNKGSKKLDIIRVSCVLYDSAGHVSGYVQKYVNCYDKGSSVVESINYPSSCTNCSKVKVYIDSAYKY